jgi:hypothetical protein
VSPLKNNEKRIRLSSRIVINRFEGSCGTFGEGKQNPSSSSTFGQLAQIYIYNKQQLWGGC